MAQGGASMGAGPGAGLRRAGRGGLAVPRLGRPARTRSFTRSRARERRRRQDEQHQERAGAGAEPQAGPQPGGRARAVRQDPGERWGRGGRAGPSPLSPHPRPLGPGLRPHPERRGRSLPPRSPASAAGAAPCAGEPEARAGAGGRCAAGHWGGGRGPGWPEAEMRRWARWGQGGRGAQVRAGGARLAFSALAVPPPRLLRTSAGPLLPRLIKNAPTSGKQCISLKGTPCCFLFSQAVFRGRAISYYLLGEKFHVCSQTCLPERWPTQKWVHTPLLNAGAWRTETSSAPFLHFPRASISIPGRLF